MLLIASSAGFRLVKQLYLRRDVMEEVIIMNKGKKYKMKMFYYSYIATVFFVQLSSLKVAI